LFWHESLLPYFNAMARRRIDFTVFNALSNCRESDTVRCRLKTVPQARFPLEYGISLTQQMQQLTIARGVLPEAHFPQSQESQAPRLARAVALLLGVLLLGLSLSRLVYPFDTGSYEAFIWSPARLAISGQNPYSFAVSPPFVMAPYGIVYYVLIGLGTKLFGLQLWFGRIVSITAAAVCLICIWRITGYLTNEGKARWFGVIAFMSSFPLQHWLAVQRPDLVSLALAFVAVTLILTTSWDANPTAPRVALIILLLAAAFFTKQTTLLPVAFVVARCWQLRDRRYALIVLSAFAVLSLALILWLNHTSGGGYLWQHWTHARRTPFDLARALRLLLFLSTAPATCLTAGTCFLALYEARLDLRRGLSRLKDFSARKLLAPEVSATWLVVLYLLFAVVFGLITSARRGANTNYYLESSIIASIVFALAVKRITEKSKWRRAAAAIVILLAVSSGWQLLRFGRGEYFRWRGLSYFMEIVETLKSATPPDSVCLSVYPELVTRAGRTFHFDDIMEYNDGFSPELQQVFREGISARRYAAILWHDNRTTFTGYKLAQLKEPPPRKFYRVYLYLREP